MSQNSPHRRIVENISSPSASLDLLGRIRSDILDGRLQPGQKLGFADLRESYGGSVGTLREALSHLLPVGLVTLDTGKGFRVAPVSAEDLIDIAQFCVDFETRALSDSIRHGDDEWELSVVTAYHHLSKIEKLSVRDLRARQKEWRQLDWSFHEACASACQSNWLLYFRRVVFEQAERYRALALQYTPDAFHRRQEHRSIYEAVVERDKDAASRLMARHVQKTVDDVLRYAPWLTSRNSAGSGTE